MNLKRKWDNYSVQQTAREEGLEQGKDQAKLEIAKALKKEGLAIDLIVKTTQLSIEEIEKLTI